VNFSSHHAQRPTACDVKWCTTCSPLEPLQQLLKIVQLVAECIQLRSVHELVIERQVYVIGDQTTSARIHIVRMMTTMKYYRLARLFSLQLSRITGCSSRLTGRTATGARHHGEYYGSFGLLHPCDVALFIGCFLS
jgi:hypothetical protein